MVLLKPLRTDLVAYSDIADIAVSGRTDALIKAKSEGRQEELAEATVVRVWGLRTGKGASIPIVYVLFAADMHEPNARPVLLGRHSTNAYRYAVWLYQDSAYQARDLDLTPDDVRALLNQEANKRRLALEKAHALQAMTEQLDKPRQRDRIAQAVRIEVWQRDGGRCVECESQANLEFDHIIPFAMGGSNTARNLQLLCGDCNRRKGMTLG